MVKTMTVAYYLKSLYRLAFSLSAVFCSIATRGRYPADGNTPSSLLAGRVTMNPDILSKPTLTLMSRLSKVGWNKCLDKIREFFVGARNPNAITLPLFRLKRRNLVKCPVVGIGSNIKQFPVS